MSFSIEREVLIHATALKPDPCLQKRLRNLMSSGIDGDCLVNMAVKEGLSCFLYKNLKSPETLNTLSSSQIERLRTLYHGTALFNLKRISDLKQILCQLNRDNTKVVLLQGMALLELIYQRDIGLRPMGDIDLWVLSKQYTALTDILIEQGYAKDPLYPNTFTKGSTTLDLHTHILWADRIKARRWLVKKSQEEIFHRAAALRVDGQEVLCLSRTDLVLYLFLHALKHRLDRLIWLVDIRHLLAPCGAPEWQRLMDRAGDLGQERALASLIYLLQGLFGLTPPAQTRGGRNRSAPNALEKRLLRQRIEKDCIPFWGGFSFYHRPKGQ